MWKNKPDMARKWTDEHGSTPVKAKKGKYQELEHPQHNITPIEHMEEKVSSKERIERLLNSRRAKRESKDKFVKAQEGQLIREKTRGTGAAIKGTDHYVMKGMDAAQEGKLIQVPTRGTGAAVKGTDHYVMEGMDAAKTGKYIKAKHGDYVPVANPHVDVAKFIDKLTKKEDKPELGRSRIKDSEEKIINKKKKPRRPKSGIAGGGSKSEDQAKGGTFTPGWKPHLSVRKAKKGTFTSAETDRLLAQMKVRHSGGLKKAKDYKKYLTTLGKMQKAPLSGTSTTLPPKTARLLTNLKFAYKQTPKAKALSVLKKVGKRTGIGKAVAAATVVAGAYEAGKRKLFTSPGFEKKAKDWFNIDTIKDKKKKKVDKKSIGGETVVMKSGGGYIDDLL